jgi:hypothetical protein
MSDTPVRSLAQQLSDPFARQLLESARTDSPEPGARDRALLGLGLAPVGLLAAAPPAAAAAATGSAGVLATTAKAAPWLLAKSLAIGLLGSVVAISVFDHALGGSTPPAAVPSSSAAVAPAASTAPVSLAAPSSTVVAPTEVAGSSPTLTPNNTDKPLETARAASGGPASAAAVALPGGGLLELEALARARRALAAHESGLALSLLDDFERRFPASQVAEEAAVLRIETLRALGRTSEAHTLGVRFLRERPSSVYSAKISAMTELRDRVSNRGH